MTLPLSPDARATFGLEDFGVYVIGGEARVPPTLYRTLVRLGIHSAEHLVDYAHAYPSSLAAVLGCHVETFVRARSKLVTSLQGHVDQARLSSPFSPTSEHRAKKP